MLMEGALANALASTESSYLFSRLSKNSTDKERKRHDLESSSKSSKNAGRMDLEMQERIDFINKQLRLERKAEITFKELNDTMREYHEGILPPASTPASRTSTE